MLLIYQLAYALPMTLLIWGVAYLVTIRRKNVQVRTFRVIIHFSTLLIINALMTPLTSQAAKNSGADGGWLLIFLILSFLSCAILRHFENKHNSNTNKNITENTLVNSHVASSENHKKFYTTGLKLGGVAVLFWLIYSGYRYITPSSLNKTTASVESEIKTPSPASEALPKATGNTVTSTGNQGIAPPLAVISHQPSTPISGKGTSNSLRLEDFKYQSRHLDDGYPTGDKIHMLSGKNSNKPYVGFILNINTKIEDELILNGEYGAAVDIYQNLDATGDATASHNLGLMYMRGMGITKDIKTGLLFLEKSMQSLPNFNTSHTYYEKGKRELNSLSQ
jgi:hypothetical protein